MGTHERRQLTSTEFLARIAELERLVATLSHNPEFGCLTRRGLDIVMERMDLTGLAAVFWDVDHLKRQNDLYGKQATNARIKEAIRARASDCVAGQVFSGDEFIAFPPADVAVAMAMRIQRSFRQLGMSATFIIATPLPNETASMLLHRVDGACTAVKATGARGTITIDGTGW